MIKFLDLQKINLAKNIAGVKKEKIIFPLLTEAAAACVWPVFVIRTKDRAILQAFLNEHGVQTLIHHTIPPFKHVAYAKNKLLSVPMTEQIYEEVLSLQTSPVTESTKFENIENTLNHFN